MNRLNIGYLACDVKNTLTQTRKDNDVDKEWRKFRDRIVKIKLKNNLDNVIVSFYSKTDNPNTLFTYVDYLKNQLQNGDIVLGPQFMKTGCYTADGILDHRYKELDKLTQIYYVICYLQEKYDVNWVGYINHHLHPLDIAYLINAFPGISEIFGFKPTTNEEEIRVSDLVSVSGIMNLHGTRQCIDNYLNPEISRDLEKESLLNWLNKILPSVCGNPLYHDNLETSLTAREFLEVQYDNWDDNPFVIKLL